MNERIDKYIPTTPTKCARLFTKKYTTFLLLDQSSNYVETCTRLTNNNTLIYRVAVTD